jgi:hypothetical protein
MLAEYFHDAYFPHPVVETADQQAVPHRRTTDKVLVRALSSKE